VNGTVIEQFERTARRLAAEPAFAERVDGHWRTTNWADYRDLVFRAAAGFIRLGVEPASGVAIQSANRAEWAIADFAAIAAGAIPTGVFVTSSPEQCAYVIRHAGARVAVVDSVAALSSLRSRSEAMPRLERIVLLDGESDDADVVSWSRLLEIGDEAGESPVRERLAGARSDDVATLIYTSGTTGNPKGVELTHGNILFLSQIAGPLAHRLGHRERQMSYLPLAHIAEQMLTLHLPARSGSCVHFVGALEQLPAALPEVRPTHFFGVPRVWEKLQAAVENAIEAAPPLRRRALAWARRRGLEAARRRERGERPGAAFALADRLVLRKVRARLGLDRAPYCASAAAPISRSTLDFFFSLGLPVFEIYGLSETTGAISATWPESFRVGSVGRPLEGVEMRIADDGEILARGSNIFRGYRDDAEATRASIDSEGWFHTGDIGAVDEEGFLRITDRKKELLVTSGGKKIPPAPIESRLREILGVGHAVVVGEQRNYVGALLTLDAGKLPALAKRAGSAAKTIAEGACCPRIRAFLESEIERVNRLFARFENVRRFSVLPAEFSIDGGELTPTLKIKRRIVYQKHGPVIDELYLGD
jgi:long-subunit acyl-CoA synthetase (AMP-forming)